MPLHEPHAPVQGRRIIALLLALVLGTMTTVLSTVPASAYSVQTPAGLRVAAQNNASVIMTWNRPSGAERYRIQVSKSADYSAATYHRYATNTAELRDLTPGTTYYLRVRVISADGTTNLSEYSAPTTVRTKAAPPRVVNPLKVASFNVKCANCTGPGELSWAERRGAVVSTIKSQMPDVIGIQEASQGWLSGETRAGGLTQFEDLGERLRAAGAGYQVTNGKRNNCVKHTTPTACVYQDQGASQGTRLFYNTTTVALVSQGSLLLPKVSASDAARYFAWGVFTQKSSGKRFFVGDTHLDPTSGADHHAMRIKQTQAIIAEIQKRNTGKLPVLLTGDFNSHKWTAPANGPYDTLIKAGYKDPLGNTYFSDIPSAGASAEKTVGAFYDTFNGSKRTANARNAYGNGTHLDYVFTSGMRTAEWKTAVNVDSSGKFVGVIPSDHNMIQVTVQLP
ncbi:endonuclease/exonuclease/phosphatase family protein [Arthrobacter sp. CP30]